jgi:hypothetical protein
LIGGGILVPFALAFLSGPVEKHPFDVRILAAVIFLLTAPLLVFLEIYFARIRRVLRRGHPVAGTVVAVQLVGGERRGSWMVIYEYLAAGGIHRKEIGYLPLLPARLPDVGGLVTVLVDPDRANRSKLYQSFVRLYRIVADQR